MVKKLDNTDFGNFSGDDMGRVTAYPIRISVKSQTINGSHIGDGSENGIGVYLCDCDQWGGGEPPCDHSHC